MIYSTDWLTDRIRWCLGRSWLERKGRSSSSHEGSDGGGGSGDIAGGSDDHEVGGMNDGNATTATAGGSGVLINVRFATADMSAKHAQLTNT